MQHDLQALIFDVDGTLADTERDGHRVSFNLAFAEAGLDWIWDEPLYGQLLQVTGGKERILFYLEQFNQKFQRPQALSDFIAQLHRRKTHHYTELLAQGRIPLRPGVIRLLHEARAAGLRLAIATTTTPDNVTALLEHSLGRDALGWFEELAAGDVVPAKKPAPDIYVYALQRMGLEPGACIAFEDSANGARAALDAGIKALVVTVNAYTQHDAFPGASVVLDHLGDPEHQARCLAGRPLSSGWVDLAYLRRLHADA